MQTDEQLMERVRGGELRQLAVLFERYHVPLFRYCLAISGEIQRAEDCVQEAFRRVLQYRRSYRAGRFKVWLYRIARNAVMDSISPMDTMEPGEFEESVEDGTPGPEPLAISEQHNETLHAALLRLRPSYREVLVLARFQELGARDIGRIVGAEEGTVRVRLYRALKALAWEFDRTTPVGE